LKHRRLIPLFLSISHFQCFLFLTIITCQGKVKYIMARATSVQKRCSFSFSLHRFVSSRLVAFYVTNYYSSHFAFTLLPLLLRLVFLLSSAVSHSASHAKIPSTQGGIKPYCAMPCCLFLQYAILWIGMLMLCRMLMRIEVDADAVPCHAALAMRSLRLLFIWWVLMRRRGIRRRDDVIELRMDWRSYVEE
jgi:hypothetical protein